MAYKIIRHIFRVSPCLTLLILVNAWTPVSAHFESQALSPSLVTGWASTRSGPSLHSQINSQMAIRMRLLWAETGPVWLAREALRIGLAAGIGYSLSALFPGENGIAYAGAIVSIERLVKALRPQSKSPAGALPALPLSSQLIQFPLRQAVILCLLTDEKAAARLALLFNVPIERIRIEASLASATSRPGLNSSLNEGQQKTWMLYAAWIEYVSTWMTDNSVDFPSWQLQRRVLGELQARLRRWPTLHEWLDRYHEIKDKRRINHLTALLNLEHLWHGVPSSWPLSPLEIETQPVPEENPEKPSPYPNFLTIPEAVVAWDIPYQILIRAVPSGEIDGWMRIEYPHKQLRFLVKKRSAAEISALRAYYVPPENGMPISQVALKLEMHHQQVLNEVRKNKIQGFVETSRGYYLHPAPKTTLEWRKLKRKFMPTREEISLKQLVALRTIARSLSTSARRIKRAISQRQLRPARTYEFSDGRTLLWLTPAQVTRIDAHLRRQS